MLNYNRKSNLNTSYIINSKWGYQCEKISLIATTVLTGLLLFPSVNDTTTHAAEVTSHDAQAVAIQAMKIVVAIRTYKISKS